MQNLISQLFKQAEIPSRALQTKTGMTTEVSGV